MKRRFYMTGDVARLLGVSTKEVLLREAAGEIPPAQLTLGKRRRWSREEIDALVEAGS